MQNLPLTLCEEFFQKKILLNDEGELEKFDVIMKKTLEYIENDKRFKNLIRIDRKISLKHNVMIDQFDKKMFHNEIGVVLKFFVTSIIEITNTSFHIVFWLQYGNEISFFPHSLAI